MSCHQLLHNGKYCSRQRSSSKYCWQHQIGLRKRGLVQSGLGQRGGNLENLLQQVENIRQIYHHYGFYQRNHDGEDINQSGSQLSQEKQLTDQVFDNFISILRQWSSPENRIKMIHQTLQILIQDHQKDQTWYQGLTAHGGKPTHHLGLYFSHTAGIIPATFTLLMSHLNQVNDQTAAICCIAMSLHDAHKWWMKTTGDPIPGSEESLFTLQKVTEDGLQIEVPTLAKMIMEFHDVRKPEELHVMTQKLESNQQNTEDFIKILVTIVKPSDRYDVALAPVLEQMKIHDPVLQGMFDPNNNAQYTKFHKWVKENAKELKRDDRKRSRSREELLNIICPLPNQAWPLLNLPLETPLMPWMTSDYYQYLYGPQPSPSICQDHLAYLESRK